MEYQTFTIEKNWHSQSIDFLKENLKKCTNFEEQKGTKYVWGTFRLTLSSSAVFSLQNCVSDFF